jgi:hypothetical protein
LVFSELSTVPPKFDKQIEELNEKVKELEQKPEFKSFSCLDFRISASELNKAICNLKKPYFTINTFLAHLAIGHVSFCHG